MCLKVLKINIYKYTLLIVLFKYIFNVFNDNHN